MTLIEFVHWCFRDFWTFIGLAILTSTFLRFFVRLFDVGCRWIVQFRHGYPKNGEQDFLLSESEDE